MVLPVIVVVAMGYILSGTVGVKNPEQGKWFAEKVNRPQAEYIVKK